MRQIKHPKVWRELPQLQKYVDYEAAIVSVNLSKRIEFPQSLRTGHADIFFSK